MHKRVILTLLIALLSWPCAATAGDMTRAFGISLGQPLGLSSKQVQTVGSPGFGLERYMLLFTPGSLPPYARHYATVDVSTKRVAAMTGVTRRLGSTQDSWDMFNKEIERLEGEHGPGMRLGGGAMWKIRKDGNSIVLTLDPQARKLTIRFADERRMGLSMPTQ